MAVIEIEVKDGEEKKASAQLSKLGYNVVDKESDSKEAEENKEMIEPPEPDEAEGEKEYGDIKRQFQAMKGIK